jgi:hypothetical protein
MVHATSGAAIVLCYQSRHSPRRLCYVCCVAASGAADSLQRFMTRARDARERIVTTAPAPDAGARREVDAHDSLIACWDLLLAANKGRYDMVGGMVVVVDRGGGTTRCVGGWMYYTGLHAPPPSLLCLMLAPRKL